MFLSRIFNAIQQSPSSKTMGELLDLNEKTKEHGLVLTPEDVKTVVVSRNKVLRDHGRVELGIEVTKNLIEVFSASPYLDPDHYVDALNELHEIFYYMRNETEDQIGDVKLIHRMKDAFDGPCGGSLELLRSKMEAFAENFRRDRIRPESLCEGDE